MLQVDENIGGRQDKKNNNSRRTKMLAGGLLLVLGCFAVGYFSVTTTTIATTAHTRVSSPSVDGMVSNLQHYPYVAITNKTPYDTVPTLFVKWLTKVVYKSGFCSPDLVVDPIAPGGTWTASSRGVCLVTYIYAALHIPDPDFPDAAGILECKHYHSSGTSYSQFSIIMDGEDACCVLSSHEKPQTC